MSYLDHIEEVAQGDVDSLKESEKSYGDSWKRRGGIGAFMMLARKWDRLENRVRQQPLSQVWDKSCSVGQNGDRFDIFEHCRVDPRKEGVIDDIRDLRRYLVLVEAELIARKRTEDG